MFFHYFCKKCHWNSVSFLWWYQMCLIFQDPCFLMSMSAPLNIEDPLADFPALLWQRPPHRSAQPEFLGVPSGDVLEWGSPATAVSFWTWQLFKLRGWGLRGVTGCEQWLGQLTSFSPRVRLQRGCCRGPDSLVRTGCYIHWSVGP